MKNFLTLSVVFLVMVLSCNSVVHTTKPALNQRNGELSVIKPDITPQQEIEDAEALFLRKSDSMLRRKKIIALPASYPINFAQ